MPRPAKPAGKTAPKAAPRVARKTAAKRPTEPPRSADPRKRRTSEEARGEILDAAERRLVTSGPAGIRLQEVAADIGVSHPTVLHHFGSREALVREVCDRRFGAIHEDLVRAIASSAGGAEQIGGMLESVLDALETHGHARVVFWLALEGLLPAHDQLRLHEVGLATHALRTRKRGGDVPPLEDTLNVVVLAAFALLAESVLGKSILKDAGLGGDRAASSRFRAWLARLLADHLLNGPRE